MGLVVILILLGVILLLAEILLVPGVGVAGFLGLASLAGSCVFAFRVFGVRTGTIIIAVNVVLVVALTVWVLRARTWKKFTLNAKIDNSVAEGVKPLAVGDVGRTVTRLAPMGQARFPGGPYEVKSSCGMVASGTDVEVILIEDKKIIVRPVGRPDGKSE